MSRASVSPARTSKGDFAPNISRENLGRDGGAPPDPLRPTAPLRHYGWHHAPSGQYFAVATAPDGRIVSAWMQVAAHRWEALDHFGPLRRAPRRGDMHVNAVGYTDELEPFARADAMTDERERIRVAYHEAGHALAAWRLGREVLAVSIDPQGEHYGQVTHSAVATDSSTVVDWLIPIQGELRDVVETDIIISLAGHLAEGFVGPQSGYGLRPDDEWAEKAATVLATRSARHRELIVRVERQGEALPDEVLVSPDEMSASSGSFALAGQEAMYHLAWLRAVTQRLVSESGPRIKRLAEALLAEPSRAMSGQRATAIIEGKEAT